MFGLFDKWLKNGIPVMALINKNSPPMIFMAVRKSYWFVMYPMTVPTIINRSLIARLLTDKTVALTLELVRWLMRSFNEGVAMPLTR